MRAGAIVSASLLAWPSAALANPTDLFGFGSRGPGRGNAMVASDDGLSSPMYNLAAGAMGPGPEVGGGYTYAGIDIEVNEQDSRLFDAHGSWLALSVPFDVSSARVAASVGLYTPDQFFLRIYSAPATEPRAVMWDNRPHRVVFNAGLSLQLADVVSFGAGVSVLGDVDGEVRFRLGSRPGRTLSDASVDTHLPTRVAPLLGVIVTPTDEIHLGARFSGELFLEVELLAFAATNLEGTGLQGTTSLTTTGASYFTPRELALGGAADFGPWTVALEVSWQGWSRTPPLSLNVDIEADLGVETPVFGFTSEDPRFRDIFVPRFGVERRIPTGTVSELTLRAGYWYTPSPVPPQRGLTSYADSNRHALTLGAGVAFEVEDVTITPEVAGQAHVLERRETRKTNRGSPGGDLVSDGRVFVGTVGARIEF